MVKFKVDVCALQAGQPADIFDRRQSLFKSDRPRSPRSMPTFTLFRWRSWVECFVVSTIRPCLKFQEELAPSTLGEAPDKRGNPGCQAPQGPPAGIRTPETYHIVTKQAKVLGPQFHLMGLLEDIRVCQSHRSILVNYPMWLGSAVSKAYCFRACLMKITHRTCQSQICQLLLVNRATNHNRYRK